MREINKIQKVVRAYYADIATNETSCCSSAGKGYPSELLQSLPEDIAGFSEGSGDPVTPAKLQLGETVLDLGSGGGLDCFLAARQVGEAGQVIGVDMTPEMLARARRDAKRLGLVQVSFREGTLEDLPVEDASVDVVLSNCVINLSMDKAKVYREVFRVLKPGGRLSISDVVANHAISQQEKQDMGAWCACSTGALTYRETLNLLELIGFSKIALTPEQNVWERSGSVSSSQAGGVRQGRTLRAWIEQWEGQQEVDFAPFHISAGKPR